MLNRPPGPAGRGTAPANMPPAAPWPQYSADTAGWQSNQPDMYSSYSSGAGAGEWCDSSSAMPWPQPNTSQSSGTPSAPQQFPANQPTSVYQQQKTLSGQATPGMPASGNSMLSSQPGQASGSAYGWNHNAAAGQWQAQSQNDASAGQWQVQSQNDASAGQWQSQWPWPQNNNQWPSSQPFQYTVRYLSVYVEVIVDLLTGDSKQRFL